MGAVYFTTNHLFSSPEQYEDDLVPDGASIEDERTDDYASLDDETADVDKAAIEQLQNPERRLTVRSGLNTLGPEQKTMMILRPVMTTWPKTYPRQHRTILKQWQSPPLHLQLCIQRQHQRSRKMRNSLSKRANPGKL